jgi:DNA-binding transcriptional regulator LsrR (DeoR family)
VGRQGQRERKRAQSELDELAIAVATLHHERGLDHEETAAQLRKSGKDVRGRRDVKDLLHRAKARDLVSINVVPRASSPELDRELGERLARKLGIRQVIAVETNLASDQALESEDVAERQRSLRESNELHSLLGAAAADHLWGNLRTRDRIAVGGGRGPAHTVAALGRVVPEDYGEAHKVLSLSGTRLSPKRASGVPVPGAEADHSALNLADVIVESKRIGNNVKLMRLPGFIGDSSRDDLIKRFGPHLQSFSDKPIEAEIAIFGAGVIDRGHELLLAEDPQNNEIKGELKQLRQLIDSGCGAPLVDVCDIFYAGPSIPKKFKQRVERIVRSLNAKVVTVNAEKLDLIEEKLVVAGGHQKLPFFQLLADRQWRGVRPTTLVIDTSTARRIL